MLIDSHCHLDFPDFNADRQDVITRARAAGVSYMLSICTRLGDFEKIQKIALGDDRIYCTVGVHPHEAEVEAADFSTDRLLRLAKQDKVAAIGETGLDYYYDNSPRDAQKKNFASHIQVCLETDLPIIVHTRDADDDTADLLKNEGAGRLRGVIHCFTASKEFALKALDLGFYISFSGILTFKRAEDLRETAKLVPMDRLLIETDSPFLAPEPHRGKRNEPAFVAHTAQRLAEIKGVTREQVEQASGDNFFTLFNSIERPKDA